jgi:hypothetical protein
MAVQMKELAAGKVLDIHVSGKLGKDDYTYLLPIVERLIEQNGKLRILLEMEDFHGWDAAGLWQDIKFDLKHFSDVERVAMVGDKRWQKGMSTVCRPFTSAKIRYFDRSAIAEAREWAQAA